MNTLSWLIYGAEVVCRMGGLVFGFTILSSIGILSLWALRMVTMATLLNSEYPSDARPEGSRDYRSYIALKNFTSKRWPYVMVAAGALIVTVIPSRTTIYMIAASEAGEAVVTSPDAVEIMGDLKSIIKKRLKEELVDAEQ